MTDEIIDGLNTPDERLTYIASGAIDRMLLDFTREERMVYAMMYAADQYKRIDSEHDMVDYRIEVDQLVAGVEDGELDIRVERKAED